MKYSLIMVTVENEEEGKKIADTLLSQKLVACVNIVPQLYSFYWWEGKIENQEEVLLLMKTKESLIKEIIKWVKELHSYEVPEIIAFSILDGNPDYLSWIEENCK